MTPLFSRSIRKGLTFNAGIKMVIYVNKKTTGPARGFQLKQKNTSPGFFRLYKSAERQPLFWNQAPFNVSRQMMSSSFSVNKWHWTIDIDWAYIQVAYWISPHMFDEMEWLPVQYNFKTLVYISVPSKRRKCTVTLTTDRSSCSR